MPPNEKLYEKFHAWVPKAVHATKNVDPCLDYIFSSKAIGSGGGGTVWTVRDGSYTGVCKSISKLKYRRHPEAAQKKYRQGVFQVR